MSWVATAVVASSVIGGAAQSGAAGKAADAQVSAADAGIAEQRAARAAFDTKTEPFRQIGLGAGNELSRLLGLDQGVAETGVRDAQFKIEDIERDIARRREFGGKRNRNAITGLEGELETARVGLTRAQEAFSANEAQRAELVDPTQQGIEEINPVVSFLRDQGFEQIQESAAARGRLGAGGTLKDLTQFNTDLASTVVPQLQNQRFNQLFNVLGSGQNAASGQGTAALNTASNVGNLLGSAGQAKAGGIVGQSNALTGTLQNVAGAVGAFPNVFGGGSAGTAIRPPGGETNLFQPGTF